MQDVKVFLWIALRAFQVDMREDTINSIQGHPFICYKLLTDICQIELWWWLALARLRANCDATHGSGWRKNLKK